MTLEYGLFLIGSYIIGSIPFAYIVVKAVKGIDIRTVGSGNVGATNVARVLGKWGFVSVLILDMLKGFIPVFFAYGRFGQEPIVLLATVAVVLGHTFTIFLKFKGGKGVATAAGAFFALVPYEMFIVVGVFILVFALTRIVSAGSVIAAVVLLLSVIFMQEWLMLKIFTALIVILVIYKHRANIVRIIKGEENRFEQKRKNT